MLVTQLLSQHMDWLKSSTRIAFISLVIICFPCFHKQMKDKLFAYQQQKFLLYLFRASGKSEAAFPQCACNWSGTCSSGCQWKCRWGSKCHYSPKFIWSVKYTCPRNYFFIQHFLTTSHSIWGLTKCVILKDILNLYPRNISRHSVSGPLYFQ